MAGAKPLTVAGLTPRTDVELRPHKSTWSDEIARNAARLGKAWASPGSLALDPMAGTGVMWHGPMQEMTGWTTVGIELEACWQGWTPPVAAVPGWGAPWPPGRWLQDAAARCVQAQGRGVPYGTIEGSALCMPADWTDLFDVAVWSPPFDTRQNDNYLGLGDYKPGVRRLADGTEVVRPPRVEEKRTPNGTVVVPRRHNYAAMTGRPLASGNVAGMRGKAYQTAMAAILTETQRVARCLIVEVKDNIEDKGGGRSFTFDWYLRRMQTGSWRIAEVLGVPTKGIPEGANGRQRVRMTQLIVAVR